MGRYTFWPLQRNHRRSIALAAMFSEITWEFSCGRILTTSSSSPRMPRNICNTLTLVHEILQQPQLFPCIEKSNFFQAPVSFCRYIIHKDEVHMDPEKIKVI